MAKQKRIALTVPPEIDSVLSELSLLVNTPKTAIIMELLNDSLPAFLEVVNAIKQVKSGQQETAFNAMADFLGKASITVNQAHLDLGVLKGEQSGKKR